MPRVSKAKMEILRKIEGGAVLSAANGHNHWRGLLEDVPDSVAVTALVASGYLGLVHEAGHSCSTGQLFYLTDAGRALLQPAPKVKDADGE